MKKIFIESHNFFIILNEITGKCSTLWSEQSILNLIILLKEYKKHTQKIKELTNKWQNEPEHKKRIKIKDKIKELKEGFYITLPNDEIKTIQKLIT